MQSAVDRLSTWMAGRGVLQLPGCSAARALWSIRGEGVVGLAMKRLTGFSRLAGLDWEFLLSLSRKWISEAAV